MQLVIFYLYLMLYVYVQRFDVTRNFKKIKVNQTLVLACKILECQVLHGCRKRCLDINKK